MPAIYATYAVIVVLGMLIREHRTSPLHIAGGSLAGATLFYVTTNFAVWMTFTTYAKTMTGLAQCYVAAIPYFGRTIASDLLFSAIFFGLFGLAERRIDAHRFAPSQRD
jgi:hypothetical protein